MNVNLFHFLEDKIILLFLLYRLLKLYEVGIMDLLKYRWIKSKNEEKEIIKISEPIILEQIYLILLIFGAGFLISFIILVFENLIFYCKN